MLSLDPELFQTIVIALLAINTLVSLLALSQLSRIKKAMGAASTVASAPAAMIVTPAAQPSPTESYPAAYAQPQQAETPVASAQPEPISYAQPQATSYSQPEPVAVAPVTYAQPQAEPVAVEPEEQPFERDGRWWFRRGTELLVYDEQTAQWQPAPQETAGGGGAPAGGASDFWKCPNCGAVNGSTATSCRMCFTARA